jgi:hypothetical protein
VHVTGAAVGNQAHLKLRNRARLTVGLCVLLTAAFAAGCGGGRTSEPTRRELQRARSGDIEVVLLAPTDALKQTRNYCTIEFRSIADHHLVDVGTVTVRTTMTMEGAPMEGFVTPPVRVAAGRYTVEMVLAMTGNWQIGIDWNGPSGSGTVTFPAVVNA